MDLLSTLGMDELPEQQTRTVDLMERYPDFNLKLGFDACCSCGKSLDSSMTVSCSNCRRVSYCSDACRQQDANASSSVAGVSVEGGEEDTALGHSSVICALLSLCADDEAVESKSAEHLDAKRLESAQDRVRSEDESYPATLANVLTEGPCYQTVLKDQKKLALHVIGASVDSEFWSSCNDACFGAYAEALADLSESRGIDTIELVFIGPECPEKDIEISKAMRSQETDRRSGDLLIRSFRGVYSKELLEQNSVVKADIVVFFNPGFTVPDYDWKDTLASIEKGIPFLSATNTELEGIADCQYLLDQDRIQTMPPGLADIFGLYSAGDEEDAPQVSTAFFSVNPFCGSRVRQSGTMANDLYVKNRWILGGILDSFDPSTAQKDAPSKKQRVVSGESNCKKGNPALV